MKDKGIQQPDGTQAFLKSLGYPSLSLHPSRGHFDFVREGRRILVIGPMGSGKTEFSSRVWRDAQITLRKSEAAAQKTTSGGADRRKVFFVRSLLDAHRFADYPRDALAYRGGYERCGESIAHIKDSFELEKIFENNPEYGTWIIDEASFYDERLAYVTTRESERRGLIFIYPTLVLNFRNEIFNSTTRLLLENATDVFPLKAYCEHPDCLLDSVYTYRFYFIDGQECPAPYFDPLIIIGGDQEKEDPWEPDYQTRCDAHHWLPGKEYTFFTLKPLGEQAVRGNEAPLLEELGYLKKAPRDSAFAKSLKDIHLDREDPQLVCRSTLKIPCLAEKALIYLFAEANILGRDQLLRFTAELALNQDYMNQRLVDNRREVSWE